MERNHGIRNRAFYVSIHWFLRSHSGNGHFRRLRQERKRKPAVCGASCLHALFVALSDLDPVCALADRLARGKVVKFKTGCQIALGTTLTKFLNVSHKPKHATLRRWYSTARDCCAADL